MFSFLEMINLVNTLQRYTTRRYFLYSK